ncbi:MAG: penicillin acylase family protein [Opitutaceae bacterium]|nr:penicillin acylase family protein [Opitutaceae bacterium]
MKALRVLRVLAAVVSVLLLLAALVGAWFYLQLRASRPQLDGTAALTGLAAAVRVERDALGIPTIYAANRADTARALGYLHAQDRFFQMDLLRRRAAGELAALVGRRALPADQAARIHGFRAIARAALAADTPEHRAVVEAYTAGVNAGLAALGEVPFEYIVLRTDPQPWRPEDSYLAIHAMALELQDSKGAYERSLTLVRDLYDQSVADFFAPLQTPADASLDGSTEPLPPIPPPTRIDLRRRAVTSAATDAGFDAYPAGSNAFAVAASRTASGGALLAGDMHLRLGVPNTWYRASLIWDGGTGGSHRVTGFTLPGAPAVVVGSNGHIAWSFTDALVDTSDVVVVEPNIIDRSLYKRGTENVEFGRRPEVIQVKGGDPVTLEVETTVWGPVIGLGEKNRPLALRWIMHEPGATNYNLMGLETATDIDAAIDLAQTAGIPAQNIVVADATGSIAWTIAGRLPRRVGYTGRYPVAWTYGDRYWDGFLPPADVPVIRIAANGTPTADAAVMAGVLWSANHRHIGGAGLATLGDGGFFGPARARQIRDRLGSLTQVKPTDLLAIQLDDEARSLARWQRLLVQTLRPDVTADRPARQQLRTLVETWEGHAAVDSVSYRLVREFRRQVAALALDPVFAPCVARDETFNWRRFRHEEPLWALLTEKPPHLLNPKFTRWDELLVAAADAVMSDLAQRGEDPARATWGRANVVRIRHALSPMFPTWLTGWLDLPAASLPGDDDTPRWQSRNFGASQRMVVSPGREAEGLAHMPGGQSGHPLSPFYRAGHEAWVKGEPTPFLPGPAAHKLTLTP